MRRRLLSICALISLGGCDLTRFTANSAGDVFHEATPAIESHWDYEMVGEALPAQLAQLDGLLRVSPDNTTLLLDGARAYASYAFGWVDDEAERLSLAGDAEGARTQRTRARLLYQRAMRLGLAYMRLRYDGFDDARSADVVTFRAWLRDELDDPEDAAAAWWVGYAWGLYINSAHPHEQVRDRAYAIAMATRSVEIDPSYYGSSGLALLAYVATQRPGADLGQAEAAWERALAASHRKNLLVLVTMARTYARKRGDRALYASLLREVVDAADVDPDMRLSNQVAKRRARRYLAEADRVFSPGPRR